VIITGDFVAHNQLDTNSTITTFNAAFNQITAANTNNVPVFVTIGNEDFWPDYSGMDKCYASQLDAMWHVWEGVWIPSGSDATFKKFGGIAYDAFNNALKVISINTVMYHTRNHYFKDDTDPCGQFAWLDQELTSAESNNQRVWIIGHIPPFYFFWYDQFQSAFLSMMQNHIGVIDGTYWGHTHDDRFFVSEPITGLFGMVASSITPNPPNPSARVLSVSLTGSSFAVKDYKQYYLDLKKANAAAHLSFATQYSFSSQYQLGSPSYQAYSALTAAMALNMTLYNVYEKNSDCYYSHDYYDSLCNFFTTSADFWACRYTSM